MASITIRQLDDALKRQLRLRAARNGRSMEDEARTILREAASLDDGKVEARADAHPRGRVVADAPARAAGGDRASGTKHILLIIGGGIAAYKALDLIRRLKERGLAVRCILTKAAQEFITPLSAGALSGERVFTDLFDPGSEFDVGHIRLAREADLVVVAPATADLMAKLAGGHADDLASAVLVATDRKVLLAPAMNPHMWQHKATQRNLARQPDVADVELSSRIEQVREHALARERAGRQRRDEFLRRLGENAAHGDAAFFQPADEIERLIGGDAAADDEENALCAGAVAAGRRGRRRVGCEAAARRGVVARAIAGVELALLEARGVAQNGARLVFHRAAVARRAQPQAPLQVVVELADGDAGHGRVLVGAEPSL